MTLARVMQADEATRAVVRLSAPMANLIRGCTFR
jgi:hypothetical protein